MQTILVWMKSCSILLRNNKTLLSRNILNCTQIPFTSMVTFLKAKIQILYNHFGDRHRCHMLFFVFLIPLQFKSSLFTTYEYIFINIDLYQYVQLNQSAMYIDRCSLERVHQRPLLSSLLTRSWFKSNKSNIVHATRHSFIVLFDCPFGVL
jgi:hypothetical protein